MHTADQLRNLAKSLEEIAKAVESGREFEIVLTARDGPPCRTTYEAITQYNPTFTYRVVYQPREFWVNVYGNDVQNMAIHQTKANAEQYVAGGRLACLHVVEDPASSVYFNK